MNHTPGPWVDDEAEIGGIHSTVTGKMLIPHSVPLSPEDRALIAAAPDLVAACKAMRPIITWAGPAHLAMLDAAIAKAEGREP